MSDCKCSAVKLNGRVIELRYWSPDCREHGTKSIWWKSADGKAFKKGLKDNKVWPGSLNNG